METTEAIEAIALREKISQDSARITAEIKAEIGELEAEYIKARKEQKVGITLLVLAFILPNIDLFGSIEGGSFEVLMFVAIFCCLIIYGIKLIFGKMLLIKTFNVSVDRIIFAKVFSILGLAGQMLEGSEFNSSTTGMKPKYDFLKSFKDTNSVGAIIALDDLVKSQLITEPHNTNKVDNILEIKYKDSVIRVAELDIKHVTGSGKNRSTKFIFHGYFVCFDLSKQLSGKTFVSTENDKQGFGELSFFGSTTAGQVRETILEWNDFEDLLHVATTDGVEARYILTPDFMHDLYNWWQGRKTNIRLSFIKNRLYILYPDDKIRLNQTIEGINEENVADYMFTIIWPLQNVMKLIDDVRL